MKRHLTVAALAAALGLVATGSASAAGVTTTLFSENFNGLTLGDSVNERLSTIPTFARGTVEVGTVGFAPIPGVYSATAPGWTVDNNFNAFGDFDLLLDPDTDMSGDYDVNLDGPTTVGTIIGNTGILNQGSSANGVDEWEGWSFVSKQFWIDAAGNQDRDDFTLGTGTVAVADPDEYDDLGTGLGGGYYNTGLSTNPIDISGATGFLGLTFDSSFLAEAYDDDNTNNPGLLGGEINNQTAAVWASYGGPNARLERVFIGDSDAGNSDLMEGPLRAPSATFENNTNDTKLIGLSLQPGDTDVQLTFGMMNAANDWWWAIDNISLQDAGGVFFLEDFESVPLGDSVNEQIATTPSFAKVTGAQSAPDTQPRPNSYTHTAPAGWDRTLTVNAGVEGNNDRGVFEWEGWSFADLDFWNFADRQGRQNFANADGIFAIADGDEWTDVNLPAGSPSLGQMNTLLETPDLNITGVGAGELYIQLDSSWRTEDPQVGEILVDYHDGNGPQVVFAFNGTNLPIDNETEYSNENLLLPLNNPVGATMATISFRYQAGNNWWWAVDNIRVGTIPEPTSLGLSVLAAAGLGLVRRRK